MYLPDCKVLASRRIDHRLDGRGTSRGGRTFDFCVSNRRKDSDGGGRGWGREEDIHVVGLAIDIAIQGVRSGDLVRIDEHCVSFELETCSCFAVGVRGEEVEVAAYVAAAVAMVEMALVAAFG